MFKPTDEQRKSSELSPEEAPNLPKCQKGDVFAYKLENGYRIFCLISHAEIGTVYAAYSYVWARFFDEIPTVESLADDYALPLGYFTSQTFPPAEKLTLIGNYPETVSSVGGLIYPHFINEAWKPATTALAKEENLSETIPLSLCMKMSDAIRKLNELREAAKKGEKEMFGFKKKEAKEVQDIDKVLESLVKNEISITTRPSQNGSPTRSKFGGRPAVPAGFEWPRFECENYDGETANRPLSFFCQIDLAEIRDYDKDNLLPERGLMLFFYEQNTMCWGFDPKDRGCARVYYFEDTSALTPADFPDGLDDEYKVKEYDLSFESKDSYPSFEELECHSDADPDWDDYDEAAENLGYDIECERHKLLGYANLIQGEMLTECERTARNIYCGDAETYQKLSEDEKNDIRRAAADWILLFQFASIQEDDYELMFGDVGNLYFYIRKQDLTERNFDKVWLVLQCG